MDVNLQKNGRQSYVLLLSGPSLGQFADSVGRDIPSDVQFIAINRKDHIERELSKIGRQVDHWCITSEAELVEQLPQVLEFLKDKSRGNFISWKKTLPSLDLATSKLVLADATHHLVDNWFRARTGLSSDGRTNSLFFLLHYLINAPEGAKSIYLFGCDGASSSKEKVFYFDQEEFYTSYSLEVSNIWADMKTFDAHWGASVRDLVIERGMEPPAIVNVNPASHYNAFFKVSASKAVEMMLSEVRGRGTGFQEGSFFNNISDAWIRDGLLLALKRGVKEAQSFSQGTLSTPIELVEVYENYNIVRVAGRFYIFNQALGRVNVAVGPEKLSELYGPDMFLVAKTLDEARRDAEQLYLSRENVGVPQLLEDCNGYNVVKYKQHFYVVHQSAGEVDFSLSQDRLEKQYAPHFFVAQTQVEALEWAEGISS